MKNKDPPPPFLSFDPKHNIDKTITLIATDDDYLGFYYDIAFP